MDEWNERMNQSIKKEQQRENLLFQSSAKSRLVPIMEQVGGVSERYNVFNGRSLSGCAHFGSRQRQRVLRWHDGAGSWL